MTITARIRHRKAGPAVLAFVIINELRGLLMVAFIWSYYHG